MCKVLMVAGIKKEHQEKVKKLLEVASKELSSAEPDGVGYAAITSKGQIYGEKWVNKEDAFKIHKQPEASFASLYLGNLLDEAIELPKPAKVYERFGKMNTKNMSDTVAIILHSRRKTTGDKTIENTHPFFEAGDKDNPDVALIHNGSVKNHHLLTKKTSTCDSETLLHEYIKNQMYYNPWAIEKFASTVRGEYTVGVLSASYEGDKLMPHLDIFKSNKELYVGYCVELETAIFCTSEYTLNSIAKDSGFTIENVTKVKDGHLIRIDAITGTRTTDLISFKLSDNAYYPYSGETTGINTTPSDLRSRHHGPQTRSEAEIINLSSDDDIEETIDDKKRQFEMNHSELFTHPYHMPKGLSNEEIQFLTKLNQSGETNFKALRLVQNTLGIKISS